MIAVCIGVLRHVEVVVEINGGAEGLAREGLIAGAIGDAGGDIGPGLATIAALIDIAAGIVVDDANRVDDFADGEGG